MSSNTVRVGRGGAGNFASQPPRAASSAATQEQLIASKVAIPNNSTARATGRGGAGNFSTSTITTARESVAPRGTSTVEQHSRSSGRGGAGNFSSNSTSAAGDDVEKQRADEIEKQVRREVEQGLKMPEPAHNRVRSEKD